MRYLACLVALLLSSEALSQTPSMPFPLGPVQRKEYSTVGAMSFYVASTGNDNYNCRDVTTPCKTIMGVRAKIPRIVAHPITISVGAGNFTGARFDGLTFSTGDSAVGVYIDLVGTLATATKAGAMTGTVTSAVAGTGTDHGTVTVTGAGWTVNELRGLLLEVTAGPGAMAYGTGVLASTPVIVSNTADTITVAGQWYTVPTGSSTFAIRDWSTVINANMSQPKNIVQAETANDSAFQVDIMSESVPGTLSGFTYPPNMHFRKMKFISPVRNGVTSFANTVVSVSTCRFDNITNVAVAAWNRHAQVVFNDNSVSQASGKTAVYSIGMPGTRLNVAGNFVTGGARFINVFTQTTLYSSHNAVLSISGTAIEACSFSTGSSYVDRFDTSSGGSALVVGAGTSLCSSSGVSNIGGGGFIVYNSDYTGFAGSGIMVDAGSRVAIRGILTGTNTGWGLSARNGGVIQISTATAITGGSGDTTVDGTNAVTYATIRGATPKVSKNDNEYSRIWEP